MIEKNKNENQINPEVRLFFTKRNNMKVPSNRMYRLPDQDIDRHNATVSGGYSRVHPVDLEKFITQVQVSSVDSEEKDVTSLDSEDSCSLDLINELFGNDSVVLYRTDDKKSFLTIDSEGQHFQIWLGSKSGLDELIYYLHKTEKPKMKVAKIKESYGILRTIASHEGKLIKQNPRIFRSEDCIYYDLHLDDANKPRFVTINQEGYKICNGSDLRFRVQQCQTSQAVPEEGGSLDLLDKYLNMDPSQNLLVKTFLISSFIPGFPHPILLIDGEAGSSKTTLSEMLKKLIDPTFTGPLNMPAKQRDLIQVLDHNYFAPFDNMSVINQDMNNDLCRAITGDGIEFRALYTNDDAFIRQYQRIILINGIDIGALREDFLDRCLSVRLHRIEERDRRPKEDIEKEFEHDRPLILGAIFNAVSKAMQIFPTIELENLSRMADFEKWGFACAEAFKTGYGDIFRQAYWNNVKQQKQTMIDDNPLLTALMLFMDNRIEWQGNMTQLYQNLLERARNHCLDVKSSMWPNSPNSLSRKLGGFLGHLKKQGILVEALPRSSTQRQVKLKTIDKT